MSRSPAPDQHPGASSTPPNPHPTTYPQFILFGDSITQGSSQVLFASLAEWYSRRLDVLNRGFSGYTAPMGYDILRQFFPSSEAAPSSSTTTPRVQLMTIFFGANDACLPGHPQHVPLADYQQALRSIITSPGIESHQTKCLLVTPPPVDEWQLGSEERTAEHTATYASACREVGIEMGIPVLDLWTIFMTEAGWQEGSTGALIGSKDAPRNEVLGKLLNDGLHFTPQGYELMYQELVQLIQHQLPDQLPEKLPMIFPDWKDKLGVLR
ncbi:uncharacterized protein Z520_07741 [Fonsecaea multimorphosa CBS 102226]|uniref:SGNH hydrolase-type esterase domain-containing protein n=1 Tax=Fonsecaea multimorphosa CBS 102226 TaxID=1442371 RepID=A0A0D2H3R2_9EURO|nr:uncharacterized protein Z520_07741 [Fonsecaea multimorphosa CBS 102226]KIX96475.1 hypothetical protein Z520_07741 [Fonsecaea multimorphosa CBS 102226]OAL28324.1 hypothetical protein AYO22_03030 [Fonsecaea multimorphosa]